MATRPVVLINIIWVLMCLLSIHSTRNTPQIHMQVHETVLGQSLKPAKLQWSFSYSVGDCSSLLLPVTHHAQTFQLMRCNRLLNQGVATATATCCKSVTPLHAFPKPICLKSELKPNLDANEPGPSSQPAHPTPNPREGNQHHTAKPS